MRIFKNLVFLSFFTLAISAGTSAQVGNANGSLSDQQIVMLLQQAKTAGMSEADVLTMLSKQGFSPAQINDFRNRITKLQNKGGTVSKDSSSTTVRRDTAWVQEIPFPDAGLPYYGFNFFNAPGASFQPNFNAATPKNYVLGPNDELIISLTGLNETTIRDQISPEGNLSLPYAGIVNLSGLTIEQATQRLRTKLSVAYPALRSGRTELFVSLGNVRSIRINVIGEAARQGTYTVSALSGLLNVLYISGGPSASGSLRKIELIRNNKVVETIDFYAFLQKGMINNLRLEDQDIIRYPVYEKRITLSGAVKRPAVYELSNKETLADLFNFAGGYAERAYKKAVKIMEIGTQEKRIKDVAPDDFAYYIPKNGDSVFVGSISSIFENRVIISGAVNRPGNYELKTGLTLSKLIQSAEGLRPDVFLNRGYINRTDANGERTIVSFNLQNILSGRESDIALLREDSVIIFHKDELKELGTISVGGAVRHPGSFPLRNGMTAEDAIALAGGFSINAASHKVEVSRLEKNKADTLANQLIRLENIEVDSLLISSPQSFKLAALDYVFVPELLNYRVLGAIRIRGEVLYPGDYSLERRNETVNEVINRAGGTSPFSSISDAQVYRNGLRIGTNVLNDSKEQFLLLPNDSIFIPRKQTFVEVKGAVFSPQIVDHTTNSFLYYISAAGGVTDNGKLKSAYVQYPNGINRKTKRFLFFRNYPKVLPGSKIIVPEKSLMDLKPKLGVAEISAGTAVLTALITLLTVLKK